MAIICRQYNLLFIMTPRTACTALGEVLCKQFGGEFLPQKDIVDSQGFIRVQKKHSTLTELLQNKLLTAEEVASFLKFTCIRNPFDNLVSIYIKKRYKYQPLLSDPSSWVHRIPHYAQDMEFCKNHSFDEWIIKHYSKGVIKRILCLKPSMYNEYTKGVDIIIRYENINIDFQNVLKKIGISFNSSIPVINRTDERLNADYRSHYSKLSKKLVEFVLYNDLKSYGYVF